MEKDIIYFDNAATTFCLKSVRQELLEFFDSPHGNPSALHKLGFKSAQLIKRSREFFSSYFNIKPEQVVFTSSGTEANNLAISGVLKDPSLSEKVILTTPIEHSSVSRVVEAWSKKGFKVQLLRVNQDGLVDLKDLTQKLSDSVALVSVMAVNNEIGTIEPIEEIGKLIHQKNPDTIFHVDAVQAFGKIPLKFEKWHIDLMTLSPHKIHGITGSGALIMSQRVSLDPLIVGGGQEYGLRSGTENGAAIYAFYLAAEEIIKGQNTAFEKVQKIKQKLKKGIQDINIPVKINTPQDSSPYILNISFKGIGSELLLRFLEKENIFVSAGSSCNMKKRKPSSVLKAIGCSNAEMDSAIRFSFSCFTEEAEIQKTLDILPHILKQLKEIESR